MNPEDRLRDALAGRAAAARTSPDALDGVFGKVSRHRRNVRVAAAAGTALSIAAVSVIASGAFRSPSERDSQLAGEPSPSASTVATASPTPSAPLLDRAIVALKDKRIVEISTTTGAVVREITTWDTKSPPTELAWSPDRNSIVVAQGCSLMLTDAATGDPTVDLGNGRAPAFSTDGSRVAYDSCETGGGFGVVDVSSREEKTFPNPEPTSDPATSMQDLDVLSNVTSVAWLDESRVVVARVYEGGQDTIVVDVDEARTMRDYAEAGFQAELVATNGTYLAATEFCCSYGTYPKESTDVLRREGTGPAKVVFTHPAAVSHLALTAEGHVVFVSKETLWRWDGSGQAEIVLRDVTALAT